MRESCSVSFVLSRSGMNYLMEWNFIIKIDHQSLKYPQEFKLNIDLELSWLTYNEGKENVAAFAGLTSSLNDHYLYDSYLVRHDKRCTDENVIIIRMKWAFPQRAADTKTSADQEEPNSLYIQYYTRIVLFTACRLMIDEKIYSACQKKTSFDLDSPK